MILPLMFLTGMCLIDTLNGLFMAWLYGKSSSSMQRLCLSKTLSAFDISHPPTANYMVFSSVRAPFSKNRVREDAFLAPDTLSLGTSTSLSRVLQQRLSAVQR